MGRRDSSRCCLPHYVERKLDLPYLGIEPIFYWRQEQKQLDHRASCDGRRVAQQSPRISDVGATRFAVVAARSLVVCDLVFEIIEARSQSEGSIASRYTQGQGEGQNRVRKIRTGYGAGPFSFPFYVSISSSFPDPLYSRFFLFCGAKN